jgi:hypothetical protein
MLPGSALGSMLKFVCVAGICPDPPSVMVLW